jgi:mannose-6-phosphate isomerase-like protein (cupin superfamily)
MLKSYKLPLSFDPDLLKADLAHFQPDEWVPHFNKGYYEGDWSGIALRAVGGKAGQLYPDPTATDDFADTPMLARCPYLQEVLAAFHCPLTSVRLLKLAARSSIREHKDYKLGFEDGEMRVHIPVVTNLNVAFFLEGEQVTMQEGEAWYIDLNLRHRVENQSDSDRIHLVIDCVVNDWARTLFPPEMAQVPFRQQI